MMDADPMNPQRVVRELSQRAAGRTRSSRADSGSSTNWYARQLKLRKGNLASLSGTLATMVPGVPYAIAAKFAHPERPVDLLRRRRRVPDARHERDAHRQALLRSAGPTSGSIFCVFNNQDLNQVTWEQRVMEGDPKFPGTQWLPDFDYAGYARAVRPEGDLLRRRRQRRAPRGRRRSPPTGRSCSRSKTDPEVPPLPPHITLEQAEKMAKAMVKGDPERVGVMEKSLRGKLAEFTERLKS